MGDLLELIGKRYRLTYEDGAPGHGATERAGYAQVIGRQGVIYGFGPGRFAVMTKTAKFGAILLRDYPSAELWAETDEGTILMVDGRHLIEICRRIGAKRVRHREINDTERQFLRARMASVRAARKSAV